MPRISLGRPFASLWLAAGTSTFGTAVTDVAVPLLAVITFNASPLEIAGLIAIEQVSWLLVGLPAGVWVDRWSAKTVMVTCDIGRAVLIGSIPAAAAFDVLTLAQLFVVAGLVGLLSVFFTIAQMAVVPSIVSRDALPEANGRLAATVTGSDLAGRSVAGVLVQALGAPLAIVVDAVSFLLSGLFLRRLPGRSPESTDREQRHFVHEVREGLRITLGDPFFRTMTLSSALSNFCVAGQYALMIVFLINVLHIPPAGIGILSAVGGVGGIAGAAMTGWLTRRYGSGAAWRTALVAGPLFGLLVPATTPGWGLVFFTIGGVGLSVGIAVASVVSGSARQALCPPELIGRMSATSRVVTWGVVPLGALFAGGLASAVGVRFALWVVAIGFFAGPLLVRLSALWTVDDLQSVSVSLG